MRTAILGISAYYHDSAAALLVDGQLVAAVQEERFTRRLHVASFPIHACRFVLDDAGISFDELSAVAFYDKPFLKFERLLETYHAFAPTGLRSFATAMPVWIKEKLFMRRLLADHMRELGNARHRVFYPEHHLSHAASAFYPSPYDESAILTIDGVGEWATTTIGRGRGKDIEILSELHFRDYVGLLDSAFTYFLGFTVNSGE
jgi:carbamoyltransferase